MPHTQAVYETSIWHRWVAATFEQKYFDSNLHLHIRYDSVKPIFNWVQNLAQLGQQRQNCGTLPGGAWKVPKAVPGKFISVRAQLAQQSQNFASGLEVARFNWDVNTPLPSAQSLERPCQNLIRTRRWNENLANENLTQALGHFSESLIKRCPNISSTSWSGEDSLSIS